ncbi:MAG TPA: tetratricopeptide repeat protein [Thermoanaerobaculia bacterium]|nr:tetratricopeptide repeat protein [Thermoanaerobaculia bacterium]
MSGAAQRVGRSEGWCLRLWAAGAFAVLLPVGVPASLAQAPEVPVPDLAGVEEAVRRAVESLREEVRAAPTSAGTWGRYAMTLDAHRFPVEAEAAYREAHRLAAGDFRWAYFLGAVVEFSDPAQAAEWFQRALEIDGAYAPAHARLAHTLELLGRDRDARAHYLRAAALDPTDPLAQLGLGNIALRAGETESALRHLERAYQLGPEIRAVVATLARGHQIGGDRDRARRLATEARNLPRLTLRFDPRRTAVNDLAVDSGSALRRAQRHVDLGQPERALEVLEEALGADPEAVVAWIVAAGLQDQLGQTEASLESARRALALDPDRLDALAVRAGVLFKLGRFDEAERVARRVLTRDPRNFHMLLVTAMVDGRRGRVDEMIRGLDLAYRARTPDRQLLQLFASLSAEVAESLGEVGRPDLAVTHMERALEVAIAAEAPAEVVASLRQRAERLRRAPGSR